MGRVLLGQSVGAFFTCNWLRMQAKQKQQQEFSSTLVGVGGPHGWRRWMLGPMGGVPLIQGRSTASSALIGGCELCKSFDWVIFVQFCPVRIESHCVTDPS